MAKANIGKAVTIGKEMAAKVLKHRRKAARTRSMAVAKKRVLVTRSVTSDRKGIATKGPIKHVTAGVIIAEGDSWFDYPFHDVLSELEDVHGFDVETVAHRGDAVEDMAYSDGQLDDFSRCVEKVLRTGVKPRGILLSGGGNDIAGDEFSLLLNHAMSSIAGLNNAILTGVIDERLREAYVTILSAVSAICRALVGETVPIIVHGYDYPVADGRGFFGGWGPLPGPWLEPGFRKKGYGAMVVRRRICVELIDRFNEMLGRLVRESPFAHVLHLDLRNTLPTGPSYKEWWANELHPTRKGFDAVTRKFAAVI